MNVSNFSASKASALIAAGLCAMSSVSEVRAAPFEVTINSAVAGTSDISVVVDELVRTFDIADATAFSFVENFSVSGFVDNNFSNTTLSVTRDITVQSGSFSQTTQFVQTADVSGGIFEGDGGGPGGSLTFSLSAILSRVDPITFLVPNTGAFRVSSPGSETASDGCTSDNPPCGSGTQLSDSARVIYSVGFEASQDQPDISVPLPSTLALFGLGLIGLGAAQRVRTR